jgi:hypothetical protein
MSLCTFRIFLAVRGKKENFGCRGRINRIKPKGSSSKVVVFLKSLYFQPISSHPIGRQRGAASLSQVGFLQELSFLQTLGKLYDTLSAILKENWMKSRMK